MTRSGARKFPPWLTKRLPPQSETESVRALLQELRLNTVCREARCPNAGECFARGTATFMILGDVCTRDCTFCAVTSGIPSGPEPTEPGRVAEAARRMGLRHVVVTSVTRDDLPDGGSGHFAATIAALRGRTDATVEVLTPDFGGRAEDIDRVLDAGPDVFNHNVETVPRLYPEVRPQAEYARSLGVLRHAADSGRAPVVKSGIMVGLGETPAEVAVVLTDLREAGCRAVTVGQYLAPSGGHHPVREFVPPEAFGALELKARMLGFEGVACGPFVRSSYRAGEGASALLGRGHRGTDG